MGDLSKIGDIGFITGFNKSGNVQGVLATLKGQYILNTPIGKNNSIYAGSNLDIGIYVNDRTDNLVHLTQRTGIFAGADFGFSKNPKIKAGTKLQLGGQYQLFDGIDKQFGTAGIFKNSYYVENDLLGVNLDLNYKYKNYGCYADKIKMNPGNHYLGSGLELFLKPEKSNITIFAGSNVEFPVKKTISPDDLEGDISIGLKINF